MQAEVVDIVQFTEEQKQAAEKTKQDIESTVAEINESEINIAQGSIHLGFLLKKSRENHYWRLGSHPTFGSYLEEVSALLRRGRSHLYSYISIVESLPTVPEEILEEIGHNKAIKLAKITKQTGRIPSDEIIKLACSDITTEELEAALFKEYHIVKEDKGIYMSFGGAYVTPEQKQELELADTLARKEGNIDPNLPAWVQRLEIRLCQAREFIATYGAPSKEEEDL